MSEFVHLHCHTEFSLLESPLRIKDLLQKSLDNGATHVTMTDNGTMYGTIQFYTAAKAKGLIPIIGCEMFLANDITVKERGWNRLLLLCKNFQGYQNLIHLVTTASLDGFYYKPRIDLAHITTHTEGLIAISPGMRGPVGYEFRQNNPDGAKDYTQQLKVLFGDDFYLGIHKLDLPMEDIVNDSCVELARALDIPIVALNDVYYLNKEDALIKDIVSCIQTGRLLHEENRGRSLTQEQYLKSPEQMKDLFADLPDAIENTLKIANQCQLVIETEQVKLPRFDCPDNKIPEDYLEELVWEGIAKKYGEITTEIKDRVKFELDVIKPMQYAPYFLIIYDFLKYCTDNGIPTGPGRGSAAGSIVAYALDITKVDPLRYKLLFERFLNPERVSMPDIDLDFCIRRRSEVIDYIVKKYGTEQVSQIATFGTMASRGVIRDVGRVLNVPLRDVDRIAKLIPSTPGQYTSIPEALEQIPELKKIYESTEEFKQLMDISIRLEGVSRHTSMHAAGVVISRDPLKTVVPLIRNDGQIVTQFPMSDLEKIGLLKMDILGLRNLTVMDDAVKLIKQNKGVDLDLLTIPTDDPNTYDLFCQGQTTGIFQLEGRGMRALIKEMKPSLFEDIIAALALYRPGPLGSGMVSEYVSNKLGKTTVKYDLPELEPILNETYGLIVYQEQVMQIASVIGGFTLGQADMLRRAMGKKKKEEMDKLKDEFLNGAKERHFPKEKSQKIFDLCYKFAEYGFNKSHSAAYALISYQTAYLKANYPVEYMTALLTSLLGLTDRISIYIQECKEMRIEILPPDVNKSQTGFSIEKIGDREGIRFGLIAIKNVGEGAIESIIKNRQTHHTNLWDFCKSVDLKLMNKRVLENLIKSGACDSLGDRAQLLAHYESIIDRAQNLARERENGQMGLFGVEEEWVPPANTTDAYLSPKEKLSMEKALLGLYLSGHPLEEYAERAKKLPFTVDSLRQDPEEKRITLLGILTNCRRILTKQKREMLLATLEDTTGAIELVVYPTDKIEEFAKLFIDDTIVQIQGKTRVNQDEVSIICDQIDPVEGTENKKLYIDTENLDEIKLYKQLKELFVQNRGPVGVYFNLKDTLIKTHEKYSITPKPELLEKIEELVGPGHYWMV